MYQWFKKEKHPHLKMFSFTQSLSIVGMPGFEPGLQTPEACIMPLYDIPMRVSRETFECFILDKTGKDSGHGSGQPVDILDKLGITRSDSGHVDLTRIELVSLPCEGNVLPLNYRSVECFT